MKRSILLIEDNDHDVALFRRAVEQTEMRNPIETRGSISEAIEFLANASSALPCLIIIDLKLPGGTGLQLLKWLHTHEKLRDIPAIVLTGDNHPATAKQAIDLGAKEYIPKPFNYAQLVCIIERLHRQYCDESRDTDNRGGRSRMANESTPSSPA